MGMPQRLRRTDYVEVFLTCFETVEDAIEKKGVFDKLALEKSEIAAVEFDPEAFALQMFQPPGSQIPPPMTLDPAADGGFSEVEAGFLALDPLEAERLLLPIDENAGHIHGTHPSTLPTDNARPRPAVSREGSAAAPHN